MRQYVVNKKRIVDSEVESEFTPDKMCILVLTQTRKLAEWAKYNNLWFYILQMADKRRAHLNCCD